MKDLYVIFDGNETEKEFLEKCLDQWERCNNVYSETQKLIIVGSIFSEMRHRVNEL